MPFLMKQIPRTDHNHIRIRKLRVILAAVQHLFVHHTLIVPHPFRLIPSALQLHFHIKNTAVNLRIDIKPNALTPHRTKERHLRRVSHHLAQLQLRENPLHQLQEQALVPHHAGKDIVISNSCLFPLSIQPLLLPPRCRYNGPCLFHLVVVHSFLLHEMMAQETKIDSKPYASLNPSGSVSKLLLCEITKCISFVRCESDRIKIGPQPAPTALRSLCLTPHSAGNNKCPVLCNPVYQPAKRCS